jgi:hypothetical protein
MKDEVNGRPLRMAGRKVGLKRERDLLLAQGCQSTLVA